MSVEGLSPPPMWASDILEGQSRPRQKILGKTIGLHFFKVLVSRLHSWTEGLLEIYTLLENIFFSQFFLEVMKKKKFSIIRTTLYYLWLCLWLCDYVIHSIIFDFSPLYSTQLFWLQMYKYTVTLEVVVQLRLFLKCSVKTTQ